MFRSFCKRLLLSFPSTTKSTTLFILHFIRKMLPHRRHARSAKRVELKTCSLRSPATDKALSLPCPQPRFPLSGEGAHGCLGPSRPRPTTKAHLLKTKTAPRKSELVLVWAQRRNYWASVHVVYRFLVEFRYFTFEVRTCGYGYEYGYGWVLRVRNIGSRN